MFMRTLAGSYPILATTTETGPGDSASVASPEASVVTDSAPARMVAPATGFPPSFTSKLILLVWPAALADWPATARTIVRPAMRRDVRLLRRTGVTPYHTTATAILCEINNLADGPPIAL